MKSKWLRQLVQEYEGICYAHRVKLTAPIINIAELKSAWATWKSRPRMITIARRLIENYPWNTVIEILKHEIAHQMVAEIHHGDEKHGALFRECAQRLGISKWAMRAQVELGDKVYADELSALGDPNDVAVRRVRKLLALGKSCERHEAELAMRRAKEICDRHNLNSVAAHEDDEYVAQILNHRKKRHFSEQLYACGILSAHFPVYVISSSLYDAGDDTSYRTIEVYGRVADVKIAEYVYHFLLNQCELLWQEECRQHPSARRQRARRSFSAGLFSGFAESLKHETPNAQGATALVEVLRGKAEVFAKDRRPRLRTQRYGGQRREESYRRGFRAGKNLKLREGMGDNTDGVPLLGES